MTQEQDFKNDLLWSIIPLSVSLLLFLIVFLNQWNQSLFYGLNHWTNMAPWFWGNVTILGDALVLPCLFIIFIRKRPDLLWALLWAAILSTLLVHTLKPMLRIPRPAGILDRESFTIVGRVLKHRSFPSGHTATAFTGAMLLILAYRKTTLRILFLLIATLIGISRIMVGAHWPLDVMAGAAAGLIGGYAGTLLSHKIKGGDTRIFQFIIGSLLITASVILTAFYYSGYSVANWFQHIIGLFCLIFGSREFFYIIRQISSNKKKIIHHNTKMNLTKGENL